MQHEVRMRVGDGVRRFIQKNKIAEQNSNSSGLASWPAVLRATSSMNSHGAAPDIERNGVKKKHGAA
ncbi:MAG: hypothetical protein IPM82_23895 [Saprospiraceae bacterium]|nr:hypothetical protein [Saprospiraceae bacterium]